MTHDTYTINNHANLKYMYVQLSILTFLKEIRIVYNIKHQASRSICDNRGLITQINNTQYLDINAKEGDTIKIIKTMKHDETTFHHTKGQQCEKASNHLKTTNIQIQQQTPLPERTQSNNAKFIHPTK